MSLNSPFNSISVAVNLPEYKKFSYVNDENKKQLSNYLDPIAQYKSCSNNKENLRSPILFNSGTFSLQKEKIFNKANDMDQSLKISVKFKITF